MKSNLDGGEKDYDFEKGCAKSNAGRGPGNAGPGYDFEAGKPKDDHGMGLESEYDCERGRPTS